MIGKKDPAGTNRLRVSCPIPSAQIDSVNRRFRFVGIGGSRLANHGTIDNGVCQSGNRIMGDGQNQLPKMTLD